MSDENQHVPFTRLKQCRHGLMLFNVNDAFVGRSLEVYGEFSEGEVDLFAQIVRPGDVIVEVGANIGAHTVTLAKLAGPTGAVFALEPQRIQFQILCANVALNSLANVWTYNAAAGETPGQIQVMDLDPRVYNNFGGLSLDEGLPGLPVPLVRVDDLPITLCRLIKVDVEGMERAVLAGASAVIERCKPILYVENDQPDRPDHSAQLIRHIASLGYQMFWHCPSLFNRNNFNKHAENLFDGVFSRNMLCIHETQVGGAIDLPRVEVP